MSFWWPWNKNRVLTEFRCQNVCSKRNRSATEEQTAPGQRENTSPLHALFHLPAVQPVIRVSRATVSHSGSLSVYESSGGSWEPHPGAETWTRLRYHLFLSRERTCGVHGSDRRLSLVHINSGIFSPVRTDWDSQAPVWAHCPAHTFVLQVLPSEQTYET